MIAGIGEVRDVNCGPLQAQTQTSTDKLNVDCRVSQEGGTCRTSKRALLVIRLPRTSTPNISVGRNGSKQPNKTLTKDNKNEQKRNKAAVVVRSSHYTDN